MKRIGIFGGTFNPIHLGHAVLAQTVYDSFGLDELIFMPSSIPPHKQMPMAAPNERYEMTKLVAKELNGIFYVSDFELKSKKTSYTYLTLREWRRNNPCAVLYFIAGSDIFATIESWEKYEELFDLANFIVVNRNVSFEKLLKIIPPKLIPRTTYLPTEALFGNIILHSMSPLRLSSTNIRGHIMSSVCREELLKEVYEYIIKNRIYVG